MGREWKNFRGISGDSMLADHIDKKTGAVVPRGDDLDDVIQLDDYRESREREQDEPVTHLVVHMTGSSIVARAVDNGRDPFEECKRYYTEKATSSHYLLGYDGRILQQTDEHLRVGHVGVSGAERRAYLDGDWLDDFPDDLVALWREHWPGYKTPQHLFAARSINDCSVGVEMPPCGRYVGGEWTALEGVDRWKKTRHTFQQHVGVALLAVDVATRWSWPDEWWMDPGGGPRAPRLPGHEDLDLYGRSKNGQGWDPGGLRRWPWWDWPTVYRLIEMQRALKTTLGPALDNIKKLAEIFRADAPPG